MADDPYTLPELPYDYGALEPHVSGQIMELHHGKHHAAYVKGANTALENLAQARATDDFTMITKLQKDLASTCRATCCTRCSGRTCRRRRRQARRRPRRADRP